MENKVLGLFLMSVHCMVMLTNGHIYKDVFENLEDRIESNSPQMSNGLSSHMESGTANVVLPVSGNHGGELDDVKEYLDNLARGLAKPVDQLPMTIDLASPFRQGAFGHGAADEDGRDTKLNSLRSLFSHFGKRAWSRLSVQTRFAPFGTKLVPNRKLENGGATLLRYGRSDQNH